MEKVYVEKLQPHPFNEEVYGENLQLPDHFLESIRENGIEEPLVVNSENTVISGHRRLAAAREIELEEVPVRRKEYGDEKEEKLAIIRHNKQREKTFSQRMEEALFYKDVARKKAKERMGASQKLGDHETGRTNDQLAEIANLGSGETFRKAEKVYKKSQNGDEEAKELVEQIDREEVSIHAAYQQLFQNRAGGEFEEVFNLTKEDFKPETIENYFPPNEPSRQTQGSAKPIKELAHSMINSGEIFCHLYFSGPPGTGKTTLSRILMDEIVEEDRNKHELRCGLYDPSTLRGKMEWYMKSPIVGDDPHKVLLLDEFDKLNKGAQRKLRRLIQDLEDRCRVIVTANDTTGDEVIDAIRGSRIRLREFKSFTSEDTLEYLKQTRDKKNFDLEDEELEEIMNRAEVEKKGKNLRAVIDELLIHLKM